MGCPLMFRKKRQPAPYFRMPGDPFNPVTGQRAQTGLPQTPGTILATFQVIGDDPEDETTEDTHDNYVVCRGFEPQIDPFFRYLHDPKTKPDTKSIKVAKPYDVRGTHPYRQGQVIVAARIATRLGFNQGKSKTTVGFPEDLDEEIEILKDDDDVAIAWLDIVTVPQGVRFKNSSGETVPAYGLMQVASMAGNEVFSISKPSANFRPLYLVNGRSPIDDGKSGRANFLLDDPGWVLRDTPGGSTGFSNRWGPKDGEWKLFPGRYGFTSMGGTDNSNDTLWCLQTPPQVVKAKAGTDFLGSGSNISGAYLLKTDGTTATEQAISAINYLSATWLNNKTGYLCHVEDGTGALWELISICD